MDEQLDKDTPLAAYRVLDLTDEKGLMCGKILGDLGADVIKIERPGGDVARNIGPFYHDIPHPEKSLYWFALNANKRGITLAIDTADGRDIFRKLVAASHFVIESYTPGYLDGLCLGYSELNQVNPRLILTSITPYGQTGPKANYKASELTCWSSGGQTYLMGDRDRPPVWVSWPQAYHNAGVEGAAASMIAHYHRELSGEGQHVDVSVQQCIVWTLLNNTAFWEMEGFDIVRAGDTYQPKSDITVKYSMPCKDGYVGIMLLGGQQPFVGSSEALVQWMDEEGMAPEWLKAFDWIADYSSDLVTQELIDRVENAAIQFLMTKTQAQLYDEALRRGIVIGPVYNPKGVWESPDLSHRGYWEAVEHPELGDTLHYCGPWVKPSETRIGIRRRAPLIGEHNQEIYQGELGLCKEELVLLREAGVI